MRTLLLSLVLVAGCKSCESEPANRSEGSPRPSTGMPSAPVEQPRSAPIATGMQPPVSTAPFPCGRDQCQPGQYCRIEVPQLPTNMMPASKTACLAIPAACHSEKNCDCLTKAGVEGACRFVEGGLRTLVRTTVPLQPPAQPPAAKP